jgi:hypothetical protein
MRDLRCCDDSAAVFISSHSFVKGLLASQLPGRQTHWSVWYVYEPHDCIFKDSLNALVAQRVVLGIGHYIQQF